MTTYTIIGKPVERIDGPDKVSGKALYSADIALPGMLWGKVLRSPHPHAKILRIDTSKALALPGVRAVITSADLPPTLIGRRILDMPMLARDKVRFIGEKVAAVAADDPDIAEEATTLIDVEYEEIPAVFDSLETMGPGAPRVHDDPSAYQGGTHAVPNSNIFSHITWSHGDVEQGFRESDVVFEHTFTTQMVHHVYIEPHACVVHIDDSGRIQVWISNKTPFAARNQLAAAIGVPPEGIRVNPTYIGGDFGGKGSIMDAPICYYLAERTGKPVKIVMTYVEELMASSNARHPSVISIRTGLKKDGRLWARQVKTVFNSGAYGAFKPSQLVTLGGAARAGGTYRLPNMHIDAYCVYTNEPPRGHMRAPGEPQTIFAVESHMDMIAREMGLDRYEFRMMNVLQEGDEDPLGEKWHEVKAQETLEKAVASSTWNQPKPSKRYGRGIAMSERKPGSGESTTITTLEEDGSVTLTTTMPETGTGTYTILEQIIAEVMTIPLERVNINVADTDAVSFDTGAGGSRVAHVAGQATYQAAQALRQKAIAEASKLTGWPEGEISLENGILSRQSSSEEGISLEQLASRVASQSQPALQTEFTYTSSPTEVTSFCAQVAEVEVDTESGQITVKKIVSAHDVGTILNPIFHQGQIEGGLIQGLGYALMEELPLEEGRVTSLHMGEYKIPTIKDIPELVTVLIESPSGPVPYQGKSIGESSICPVAAAIANAVEDACGVRITDLPITAEKVYRALRAQEKSEEPADSP